MRASSYALVLACLLAGQAAYALESRSLLAYSLSTVIQAGGVDENTLASSTDDLSCECEWPGRWLPCEQACGAAASGYLWLPLSLSQTPIHARWHAGGYVSDFKYQLSAGKLTEVLIACRDITTDAVHPAPSSALPGRCGWAAAAAAVYRDHLPRVKMCHDITPGTATCME